MTNKKEFEILRHPKNVNQMAYSLRKLCNQYWDRKIALSEFEEMLEFYYQNHSEKIFENGDFRKTLQIISGKERIKLLSFYKDKKKKIKQVQQGIFLNAGFL